MNCKYILKTFKIPTIYDIYNSIVIILLKACLLILVIYEESIS